MKTIEFNENQLGDLSTIGAQLFADEQDPRSSAYKRQHIRPDINWLSIILRWVGGIVAIGLIFAIFHFLSLPFNLAIAVAIVLFVLYIIFSLKSAVVCAVKIYQRYAPDSLRNKCRFEPSCSQYWILAIEKYGLITGVIKGIDRLRRCKPDNGGFDYP